MAYEIIEPYDEKGRLIRTPEFYIAKNDGYVGTHKSHTYSALYMMQQLNSEEVPFPGLLEKMLEDEQR